MHLMGMPQTGGKKHSYISFKPSETAEKRLRKDEPDNLKAEGVNHTRPSNHYFTGPMEFQKPLNLPRKISEIHLQKVRLVGGVPVNSDLKRFPVKSLSSPKIALESQASEGSAFSDRRALSPRIAADKIMQKETAGSPLLSVLTGTGRIVKTKLIRTSMRGKVSYRGGPTEHLTQAKRLQLFRALLKQPLPFLDLHVRFGVSKQTVRSFVRRGLLTEIWGPKAVGLRFRLSRKGMIHLKGLEKASWYDPTLSNRRMIHLKRGTF